MTTTADTPHDIQQGSSRGRRRAALDLSRAPVAGDVADAPLTPGSPGSPGTQGTPAQRGGPDTFSLPETLLIADAARLMGVSRRTVYYRIRDGQLRTVRTSAGSTRVIVPSLDELVYLGLRKNAIARRAMAHTGVRP